MRSRHSVAWTHRKFVDAKCVLRAVLQNECALRRAEGLRAAYIDDTLYVDGEVRPFSKNDHNPTLLWLITYSLRILFVQAFHDSRLGKEMSTRLHRAFCDNNVILPTQLKSFLDPADLYGPKTPIISFFTKFLDLGYFYPVPPSTEGDSVA